MTKAEFNSDKVTDAQREAFYKLQKDSGIPFHKLLARSTLPCAIAPYIGVNDFHGMFVGIEPDGYTHT